MMLDINKFSFAQMCSNDSGKTSGSGTMGILVTTAGVLGFLAGVVDHMWFTKTGDVMLQSTVIISLGVGLLGYRKNVSSKTKDAEINVSTEKEEPIVPINS